MSIKTYILLAAVFVLVVGESFALWKAYSDGEAKAQAREIKAAQAQAVKDQVNAKKTVDSLQAELASLRNTAPPVGVRCTASSVQAPKPARGTIRPAEPATPAESVPEVPGGTGAEPDLGPSLRLLAQAADIVSARDRACLTWAKGL